MPRLEEEAFNRTFGPGIRLFENEITFGYAYSGREA